jgi:hypothetical protein
LERRLKDIVDKVDDKQAALIKLFKEKENIMIENESKVLGIEQAERNLKFLVKIRNE